MIRDHLFSRPISTDKWFRWRGGEVSRLEGFSDAVFGFALTLLVVSLEVPQTLDELLRAMRGFILDNLPCFGIVRPSDKVPNPAFGIAKAGKGAKAFSVGKRNRGAINRFRLFKVWLAAGGFCAVKLRFCMRAITERFVA